MNEQLKSLYDNFYMQQPSAQLLNNIKRCHDLLIERLDKAERKLVLEIIDCKDEIAEDMSIDSFICGFHLAWKLSIELNMYGKRLGIDCDSETLSIYQQNQKEDPK